MSAPIGHRLALLRIERGGAYMAGRLRCRLWGLGPAVLVRRFHILCFAFLSHLPFGTANGELLRVARDFVEKLLRSEATFSQFAEKNLVEDNDDRKSGMLFRRIQT